MVSWIRCHRFKILARVWLEYVYWEPRFFNRCVRFMNESINVYRWPNMLNEAAVVYMVHDCVDAFYAFVLFILYSALLYVCILYIRSLYFRTWMVVCSKNCMHGVNFFILWRYLINFCIGTHSRMNFHSLLNHTDYEWFRDV